MKIGSEIPVFWLVLYAFPWECCRPLLNPSFVSTPDLHGKTAARRHLLFAVQVTKQISRKSTAPSRVENPKVLV